MKKAYKAIISAAVVLSFIPVPVQAKHIADNTYKICKNDIFTDFDNMNVKKIVTEVKNDGTFIAEDLSDWIKTQDVYNVSVVEEKDGTKEMFYEFHSGNAGPEYDNTENTSYIHFEDLVQVGEIINSTDTLVEEVTHVNPDGSFYTEVRPSGFDLILAEEPE